MDVFALNNRPDYTIHPQLGTLEKQGNYYVAANGTQYERSSNGQFTRINDEPEADMADGWHSAALVA